MKKLICKLLILTLIVSAVILPLNIAYIKAEKNINDETARYRSIPEKLDMCNFGSSHGLYGFDYEYVEKVGLSGFNFSLDSQSLSYDYRIMKTYGDRIVEGTLVFIVIPYGTLFQDDETKLHNFESMNKRYYKILPKDQIKKYNMTTDILVDYLPALGVKMSKLKEMLIGDYDPDRLETIWNRQALDLDLHKDAENAAKRHLFRADGSEKADINTEELEALYSMIEYCKNKGAIPVMITTPVLREYIAEINKIDPEYICVCISMIKAISEERGVPYYDYSNDERFIDNRGLFMNADHLNKDGAKVFTDIIMNEVVSAAWDSHSHVTADQGMI